jgi:5-hydroxyisourate hydrolase
MSQITTHVLDTARGAPAAGVPVRLERVSGSGPGDAGPGEAGPGLAGTGFAGTGLAGTGELGRASTDADGRVSDLGPERLPAGTYRLVFDTAGYFAQQRTAGFFPEVAVTFTVGGEGQHYHVPLLLSPFGYATYRGS